jgi:hypothetical protein
LGTLAGEVPLVPVETSVKGVEALVDVMEAAQEYREALWKPTKGASRLGVSGGLIW